MGKWTDEAKKYTKEMAGHLLVGAKYVPPDRYDWSPGGAAKTASQIICECVTVNRMIAGVLRGEQVKEPERGEEAKCCQETLTYERAKEQIEDSCAEVCAALDLWADKDLTESLQMPWGMSMPAESVIFLPGTHMCYHNGQLNYIQLLLGDAEMHWE